MSKAQESAVYSTPDVTAVQKGAVATFVGSVVAAHVAGIDDAALYAVIAGAVAISIALIISDAAIRRGRARGATK